MDENVDPREGDKRLVEDVRRMYDEAFLRQDAGVIAVLFDTDAFFARRMSESSGIQVIPGRRKIQEHHESLFEMWEVVAARHFDCSITIEGIRAIDRGRGLLVIQKRADTSVNVLLSRYLANLEKREGVWKVVFLMVRVDEPIIVF